MSISDGDVKPDCSDHGVANNGASGIEPGTLSTGLMIPMAMFPGRVGMERSSCCAYLTRFSGRSEPVESSISAGCRGAQAKQSARRVGERFRRACSAKQCSMLRYAAVCCGMQSRERREQDGVAPPVGDGRGGGLQQRTARRSGSSSRQGKARQERRREQATMREGRATTRPRARERTDGGAATRGGEGRVLSVRCVQPRGYQQSGSLQGKNPRRPGVGSVDWRKGGRDHWDCGGERRKQWKGRGRERRQPRGVVAESEEHEHGVSESGETPALKGTSTMVGRLVRLGPRSHR